MGYNLVVMPDEDEWNTLVSTSAQGNIFSDTRYLRALNVPYACYLVKALNGETLAGVAIIENDDSMHAAPFPYTPYQGILFSPLITALPNYKRVTTEFRLTEYLIQALCELYGNFSMALSPAFSDLRPFLWYNYHEANSPRFNIRNRYTATLDLSGFELESFLKKIRACRRDEFKKATAEIADTTDVALFLDLYNKTFKRQEIVVGSEQLELIKRIVLAAIENGFGRLSKASTNDGVASMALFIFDKHTAYYLFGANNPELRATGASTALMINNICAMSDLGLSKLDFVGVNSPNRGDYKLSFNSVLTPYTEVQIDFNRC